MQSIQLSVPDEMVNQAIDKKIDKRLKELTEINWDTKTAAKRMGMTPERIRAIFRVQSWKSELDSERGGPVLYPYKGQRYQINPQRFVKFCQKHWSEIMTLKTRG